MTTDANLTPESQETACLRCGVCCEEIFIPLTTAEARNIAENMSVAWEDWLCSYIDGGLDDADTLFLRKADGVCVFLERGSVAGTARCTVHDCKPSACRDWAPEPGGKYCREGQSRRMPPARQTGPSHTETGALPEGTTG